MRQLAPILLHAHRKQHTVEVYDNGGKTCDRYTAIIDGHVYTMSDNANMPNGVCLYYGNIVNVDECGKLRTRLPHGVKAAIASILREG